MANNNVVSADLNGGWSCVTAPLWQWDYGQVLEITGIDDLPSSFVAHCANRWDGSSQTVLGSNGRISIPNDLLTSGEPVYVWIVLTADGTDGETKYKITIPVNRRAAPTDYPTTAQQSAITQAINALNTAAANAAAEVAAELVDPTLAVSGKAADAAKTGEELGNLKSDLSFVKSFGVGQSINPIDIDTAAKTVSVNSLLLHQSGTNANAVISDSVSYADTTGNTAFIAYDWDNGNLVALSYADYRNVDLLKYSTLVAFAPSHPINYASPFAVTVDGKSKWDNSRNYLCTILPNPRSNASNFAELDTTAKTVTIPAGTQLVDDLTSAKYNVPNTVTIDYSSLDIIRPVLIYYDKSTSEFGTYNLNGRNPTTLNWLWVAIVYYYDMCINIPYYVNGNLLGQNLQNPANIALGNEPAYVDVDSQNKIVTFPVGTIIWNPYIRTRYVTLTANNNTCDYSAVSGNIFNLYYDYVTNTIRALGYYLMPNSADKGIFIGTIKQNGLKVTTSFNCEYRVDGYPVTDALDGYWKENINSVIDKVALRQNYENGACFAFITDIHWETNWKKSPEMMRYLTEHSRIKLVLNGGDNASGGGSDIDAQKKWLYECTGAFSGDYDYYSVNGNHDNNAVGGTELIDATELRNLMLPNPHDVDYGDGNYYWFSNDGTTYICLDTGTNGAADATQIAWAKNIIDSTTDNYIIILLHIVYLSNSEANPCTFFTDLMTAINSATNKSKIQAIFAGHQHSDHNYTFNGIPVITTDTDSRFSDDGITRAKYTLTEHCFDVVTINYDSKTINCDRVGAIGTDREITY